jgi:hypothetical protein
VIVCEIRDQGLRLASKVGRRREANYSDDGRLLQFVDVRSFHIKGGKGISSI